VVVWVQDGDWYLEIRTPCRHLQADNSCGIYHSRPQICRDYGWPDADNPDEPCEYFTGDDGYDLYFETAEAFDAWSRVALAKRAKRLAAGGAAAKSTGRRGARPRVSSMHEFRFLAVAVTMVSPGLRRYRARRTSRWAPSKDV
jgi:hypothetical protein